VETDDQSRIVDVQSHDDGKKGQKENNPKRHVKEEWSMNRWTTERHRPSAWEKRGDHRDERDHRDHRNQRQRDHSG